MGERIYMRGSTSKRKRIWKKREKTYKMREGERENR